MRATVDALNADGFRVIAVAVKELPARQETCGLRDESDLVLVGYIAFLDPPKASAGQALAALAAHGVQVKVLTGDNDIVTRKICSEVNLPVERVVLGCELESLTQEQIADLAERTQVFARLSPMQKAAVIAALQKKGHVVGFLGDGINDGPALKTADVGVSVDSAVDIAKEYADIILLEKSLLVLDARRCCSRVWRSARSASGCPIRRSRARWGLSSCRLCTGRYSARCSWPISRSPTS